jgi:hypothetical protein
MPRGFSDSKIWSHFVPQNQPVLPYHPVPELCALPALAMSKISFSSALSPDQLKQLAEIEIAQARRIESSEERLRRLTLADALTNLAEIKTLLLEYERRLVN